MILCSGKVYYDLIDRRKELGANNVAIIRIEQFYPLSTAELMRALNSYAADTEVIWLQEEPANMGAWQFIKVHFSEALSQKFRLRSLSRVESASPSTGSSSSHKLEQDDLLQAAFADLPALTNA